VPSNPKQCSGTRRDGRPCAAPALADGPYCFAHAPERAADRQAAYRKGGLNRASIVRLRGLCPPRLVPVFEALEQALGEVHDGKLDPRQAVAMAALARAMVAVLQAGEVEQRLRELEQRTG
jgi:hypothetical protein